MKILPSLPKIIRRRLIYASVAIVSAISFGAIGFFLIEGFSVLDSIYLATETVTTVGYGDIAPKTPIGRIFAILFMLVGGGTVLYSLTVLAQAVIQSEIVEAFGAGYCLEFRDVTFHAGLELREGLEPSDVERDEKVSCATLLIIFVRAVDGG